MVKQANNSVAGEFIESKDVYGGEFYKISNVHQMPAFFINLASNSDIWMFLSSNGSLTAGRKNADRAIFPYETDDRIHLNTSTGPKTIVRIDERIDGKEAEQIKLWEPFDKSPCNSYSFTRNLYKNIWGNALIYEEINESLNLSFWYKWESSEKFGIIRSSCLTNLSDTPKNISVLDGVENIIPYGIPAPLQQGSSCLTDAYKRGELIEATALAVYSLSSQIVDMPEPVEVLNANVAWSICESGARVLLASEQIKSFCQNTELEYSPLSLGKKCAYFTVKELELKPLENASWMLVMDCCLSQPKIAELQIKLQASSASDLEKEIREDILKCTLQLKSLTASADALQYTKDTMSSRHHFINVLYNNMRGGVFDDSYNYDYEELIKFVKGRNKELFSLYSDFFESMKEKTTVIALKQAAYATKDSDLIRLCLEFLPVCFSRRHGDPSRPWNHFFINLKDENGKRMYNYEGNWRDIFQNWESMSLSFPEYLENIIAKFLNASTADGFNPYRLNQQGIDWEIPEPHNPFSGLGYWGDHQIVYLTKLLEALEAHDPAAINRFFDNDVFCYANVPYRIHSYESILQDSKNTIDFDHELHNKLLKLAEEKGSDGKLIQDENEVYYASFMEKLAVPVLAKLANLVVGGGIWMNTQRPEWNDANNAIVGYGLSMVTVYQLRRHLVFLNGLLARQKGKRVEISNEVYAFADSVYKVFDENSSLLNSEVSGKARKEILDGLGKAFGKYRDDIYKKGFSGKQAVSYEEFARLFTLALKYIDFSIEATTENKLYSAYNLLSLDNSKNTVEVLSLYPMLEGQTAALGSGKLQPKDAKELVETMLNSGLYSPEQNSFYLYPLKNLKTFMQKNIVPWSMAEASRLISALLENNDNRLFTKDSQGNVRINESLVQLKKFVGVLNELKETEEYRELVAAEYEQLCQIYEEVFKHKEFTGRSGIMYKYEGIGCIYWHQNAKFLLSIGEIFFDAYFKADEKDLPMLRELKELYYSLRKGLGFEKTPEKWGAFPFDPYSHTPYLQGAQQPGMTGQVKEEILTRRLELGLIVKEGQICFAPALLRRSEFVEEQVYFTYFNLENEEKKIMLPPNSLAFTVCQIPVVYCIAEENRISCQQNDGVVKYPGLVLDEEASSKIFRRSGEVMQVTVMVKESELL